MNAGERPLLTARQAECLRLVPVANGSKEIARLLGIGPGTVDQHIKAATRALGETSRHAAARKLAAIEADAASPKLDSQTPAVAAAPFPLPPEAAAGIDRTPGTDWTMREQQAPFVVGPESRDAAPPRSLTTGERLRNRLTWGETLMLSWLLSGVLGVSAGAVIAGVVLLMRFLISVSRHGG